MSVVIVGGTKGGPGKTTMAVNLAVEIVNDGKTVCLFDTDRQQSASMWAAVRDTRIEEKDEPLKRVPVIQKYGTYVNKEIEELKDKFDHIIVDAGGFDSPELRSAMLVADKIYAPMPSSQLDIWGMGNLIDVFENARAFNQNLEAVAFLNKAEPNPKVKLHDQAREAMESIDDSLLRLSDVVVHNRICFVHSIPVGRGVSELELKNSKAIEEMKSLYSEIFGGK